MSNNRRDQILNMAFGDSDTDGMSYESLSAEERAELDTLINMRDGLKNLSDVPECQLSSERLRGAILGNAVKKNPVHGWSYATATLAFVVVALIAFKAGAFDQSELNVTAKNDSTFTVIDDSIDLSNLGNDSPSDEVVTSEINSADLRNTAAPASEVSEVLVNSSPGYDWSTYALNNRSSDYDPRTEIIYYPLDQVELVMASIPAEDELNNTLVVVDNSAEDMYGSYEATEVETFGDVVFGG